MEWEERRKLQEVESRDKEQRNSTSTCTVSLPCKVQERLHKWAQRSKQLCNLPTTKRPLLHLRRFNTPSILLETFFWQPKIKRRRSSESHKKLVNTVLKREDHMISKKDMPYLKMARKKTFQQPDRKAGDACTHVASRTSLKCIHVLCHKRSSQHCAPVSAEGISGCLCNCSSHCRTSGTAGSPWTQRQVLLEMMTKTPPNGSTCPWEGQCLAENLCGWGQE